MSRILVTGATGFLGSAIVEQLQAAGLPVARPAGERSLRTATIIGRLIFGMPKFPRRCSSGVSGIIHCAGLAHQFDASEKRESSSFQNLNCEATANLARQAAAHGVKRFVFVSSVSVYGSAGKRGPRNEEAMPIPRDLCPEQTQAEIRLLQIASETGLQVLILRMTTLYRRRRPRQRGPFDGCHSAGAVSDDRPRTESKEFAAPRRCGPRLRACRVDPTNRPAGIWNVPPANLAR